MSVPYFSFAQFGPNSGYVEELYSLYRTDPFLVGDKWAAYFSSMEGAAGYQNGGSLDTNGKYANGNLAPAVPALPSPSQFPSDSSTLAVATDSTVHERIYRLVSAYRGRAHLKAKINPLHEGFPPPPQVEDIHPEFYEFTDAELAGTYPCAGFMGQQRMQLRELVQGLEKVYCGSIGFEFGHLLNQEERLWLQDKIERRFEAARVASPEEKRRRLFKIIDAEAFEGELHKKYVGHKRFSLEGAETTIPMLTTLVERGAEVGIAECVLGMAHRGRLNVLRNILDKPLTAIFSEFNDQSIFSALGSGDVKYHMGYKSFHKTPDGGQVKLSLASNPSHLESVNPVVEGMTRASQDIRYDGDRKVVLPILIHGDAAVAGQGVVTETYNMANVAGYRTGGTVHLIINNQIGFTTNPEDARSSVYCTDFIKAIQALVIHVNGEDVEACCWASELAIEFRNRYQRDVALDLYCYRKYGHNEGDDPSFTQPVSYKEIRAKQPISQIYAEQLRAQGVIQAGEVEAYLEQYHAKFEEAHAAIAKATMGEACPMHGRLRVASPDTSISKDILQEVGNLTITVPSDFVIHPKLKKILEKRIESLTADDEIDWGFAEVLAFGSLAKQGHRVRLSGQDCGRATFSQRHLTLYHHETGEKYNQFSAIPAPGKFEVHNSVLSEFGVMGFEYGYSLEAPKTLILWEGQFGDFVNGAQITIDQYLSSAEQKWNQLSGLVLLLPHGYEGQGPEHSSARLERFLQLCADGNMVVCYPSSAAQYFHLLRRQALADIKRPLVVMTPKSMLRSAEASSPVSDLTSGQFHTTLEHNFVPDSDVEHVVLCTGKVYYEIVNALAKVGKPKVKVIRIEQLYPFPQFEIKKAVKQVKATSYIWVQEEPLNMGAWFYLEPYLRIKLDCEPQYIGRPLSASTATGSPKHHAVEQEQFLKELIDLVS